MSLGKMRTTFDRKDLERAAKAPHKIYGLYEQIGQPGRLKHLPVSPSEKVDSGLGDELPEEDSRPKLLGVPPSALADSENQDSGLGPEPDHMDVEEDDVEADHVVTTSAPRRAISHAERPRKPKTTQIIPKTHSAPSLHRHTSRSVEKSESLSPPVTTQRVSPSLKQSRPSSQSPHQIQLSEETISYFLPNKDGDTGLHLSVIHSNMELFDQLLQWAAVDMRLLGCVLDEQNSLYQTPLHLATHTQQTEMIRKLLMAGASPFLTDHKGNTPMHIACKLNTTKCLDEILRYTMLRNIRRIAQLRNNEGFTCVHVAVRHSNTDALRKLRSMGVDMNMKDFHSGKTALHIAVEKNSLSVVQFLVEKCEVDVNAMTYSCCTSLHVAAGRGDIATVAYLLSMGANPDLLTDEGDSPLDLAVSQEVVTLLTKAAEISRLF